jgi:hypothetical protein
MQREPVLCQFPARREHGRKFNGLVWKVRCSHTTEGPSGAAGGVGLSQGGGEPLLKIMHGDCYACMRHVVWIDVDRAAV